MIHQIDDDVWTPKIVGDCLIEAIKWAQHSAGATGPAGYRGGLPDPALTSDERFLEDWASIDEIEEFEPPRQTRRAIPPAKVSQYERILAWPTEYLADFNKEDNPVSWAVFRAWVRCKLTKGVSFDECCRVNEWSRATAYRLRDHVLSKIAIGLTTKGIKRGQH